jgi:hypothetical protein
MKNEFESGKGSQLFLAPGSSDRASEGSVARSHFACGVTPSQAEPPPATVTRDDRDGGGSPDQARSADDDMRVCIHEASHAVAHRLNGSLLGGMTADASHAHVVRALADQLKRERTMDGAAIDLCITQAISTRAAEAECKRRADWARICASAATFKPDGDFPRT